MKANFKSIAMLVLMIVAVILAVTFFTNSMKDEERFGYSDVLELFENDLVESYEVDGKLNLKLKTYVVASYNPDGTPVFQTDEKTGKPVFKIINYQLSYNFQLSEINDIAREKIESGNTNLTDKNMG